MLNCFTTRRITLSLIPNSFPIWAWLSGTRHRHEVGFDEPQLDADGDGPYRGGQIWESALSLLTDRPN